MMIAPKYLVATFHLIRCNYPGMTAPPPRACRVKTALVKGECSHAQAAPFEAAVDGVAGTAACAGRCQKRQKMFITGMGHGAMGRENAVIQNIMQVPALDPLHHPGFKLYGPIRAGAIDGNTGGAALKNIA